MLADVVTQALTAIDRSTDKLTEMDILQQIVQAASSTEGGTESLEYKSEHLAFIFCEDYSWSDRDENAWGTYYGPLLSSKQDENTVSASPDIAEISSGMIEYWILRSQRSNNPILKARYAGLAWEFHETVCKSKPDVSLAFIHIDSIVRIAKMNLHEFQTEIIAKLKHALILSIKLNNTKRIDEVRDCIIEYEDKYSEDDKIGTWGFSFDTIIYNKKANPSQVQIDGIISDLEHRLDRLSDAESINVWAIESAVLKLVDYYRRQEQTDDLHRVLDVYADSICVATESASATIGSVWLNKAISILKRYGYRDRADQLLKRIRTLGASMSAELKTFTATSKVSKEELSDYVNAFVAVDCVETAFLRIASHYIPDISRVAHNLDKLSTSYPVSFLFPISIQDYKGRQIAEIGPLASDREGHIIQQMIQDIQITSFWLRSVIESLVYEFNLVTEDVLEFLFDSPAFEGNKHEIIERGVGAYLEGDVVVALHLLIPQIENAVRMILELCNEVVLKPRQDGDGFQLITFDHILRNHTLRTIFGENACFYFRVLYTDPRGLNMRNDICHGIRPYNDFNCIMADRVFHTLLVIALTRKKEGCEN